MAVVTLDHWARGGHLVYYDAVSPFLQRCFVELPNTCDLDRANYSGSKGQGHQPF